MKKNTKKPFSEPKMTKCEQPLDRVTMTLGQYRNHECNDEAKPFAT